METNTMPRQGTKGDDKAKNPPPSPFALKLKQFRTQAGLSQAALADKAGMHVMALSKIERGERGRGPSWDTVQALAKALGVSCEDFQADDAQPETPPAKRAAKPKK